MARDLLGLLANKSNQSILGLLAVEPAWPRKVGQLVGLSETEVSRRLKRMEDLGLVKGEWAHVGKNVKLYKLAAAGAAVHFTEEGVALRLEPLDGTARPSRVIPTLTNGRPSGDGIVGRRDALAVLDAGPGVVLVEGLPGIGKTSLLAKWADAADHDLFWHDFRGVESLRWLANRMAVHRARHGDRTALDALDGDLETADLQQLVCTLADRRGACHVFDDVHTIEDPALRSALGALVTGTTRGLVVAASREPLKRDPTLTHVRTLRLEGLEDADVRSLLAAKGIEVEAALLPRIRDEVGGHPLALNLLLEAARRLDVPIPELLDRIPEQEVEEYLLNEVAEGLREDERQTLVQASVFRTRFSLDDLRALTQKDPERALSRLRRRLLVSADDEAYELHEVIRNFFYKRLQDRARLHEKVAARYQAHDTPEGRLEAMFHYLAADRRDKVLDLLEQDLDLRAFDLLDLRYHSLYEEILSSFQESDVDDPVRWAVIEDDRGDLAFHRGAHEQALEHYARAEAVFARQSDGERLADLGWKRGLTLRALGRSDDAKAAVAEGLRHAEEGSIGKRRLSELGAELA